MDDHNKIKSNKTASEPFDNDASIRIPVDETVPSTLKVSQKDSQPKKHPPRINHLNVMGQNSIVFYIGELDVPLVIQLTKRMTLGRYAASSREHPSLDLTVYNGYELGVSRLHATIYRKGNGILFEDLGTINGSFINTEVVQPHTPRQLEQGDVIRLGQLTLETYFGLPEPSDKP